MVQVMKQFLGKKMMVYKHMPKRLLIKTNTAAVESLAPLSCSGFVWALAWVYVSTKITQFTRLGLIAKQLIVTCRWQNRNS